MKINEIIRERRITKGFTQEQIANYLGVSTPAVNKWEKGISYPDITLLPMLARILDTDLNTLLSFQDDLSQKEIALFMNEVSETIDKNGFEAGFNQAINKIKEFPTCDLLIYNLAMLLDGTLLMSDDLVKVKYQEKIEELYDRVAQSNNIDIKEQVQVHLISKAMTNQNYEKAQEMLDTLSTKNTIDIKKIQAEIYIGQGKIDKGARLIEEKLLATTNEIHSLLMVLMDIALKEARIEDAEYIAEVDKQVAQLLDLWEYNSYVGYFQLYSTTKNRIKTLHILIPMLKSLTKKWDINQPLLYRHIQTKEVDKSSLSKLQKLIVQAIDKDEEFTFIKDDPKLQELLKEIEIR